MKTVKLSGWTNSKDSKINEELFNIYEREGIVTKDIGDGAWGWTERGEKDLPYHIRVIMSGILYNDEWYILQGQKYEKDLNELGYAFNGYPLEG